MFAAFIKLTVRAGKKEELLDYFKWECEVAREEPYVLRFDVFEDPRDENVIFYYEAYADEAGYEKHKTTAPMVKWFGGFKDECVESTHLVIPAPSMTFCTLEG